MESFESSIFLRCLKKVGQVYLAIEEKLSSVYLGSLTHQLIVKTAESIKIGFEYSIFGRLTEIYDDTSRDFFQTSKTTKILLNWISKLRDATTRLSTTSSLVTSIGGLKCDFLSRPLKVGGAVVIISIMTNLVLSIILQRQITLWGWLIRGLLLFIGISRIFCNVDWPTVIDSSIIFRRISKRQLTN